MQDQKYIGAISSRIGVNKYLPQKPLMMRNSLNTKIIILILPVILVLLGLGGWLLHTFVSDLINEMNLKSLVEEAETIELVLQHAFMTNDVEMLQQTIFDASLHSSPDVIRVLDREGIVLASSIPTEIGVHLDYSTDYCSECHSADDPPLTLNKSLSSEKRDEEVIVTANRVENRVSCQNCHTATLNSLGVILTETPVDKLGNWIPMLGIGLAAGALLFAILISGAVYVFISQRVTWPLRELTLGEAHKSFYEGKDEIERVAVRLQHLEKTLDERERLIADQHKNLDALLSLHEDLGEYPTIENFFNWTLAKSTLKTQKIGQ